MRSLALVAALLLCAARAAGAQLPPNEDWHTIRTRHFWVHFTPAVEEDARRAAVNAERAYAELSTELVPPRGPIDLVVSDNVDFVNGYATPFPTNTATWRGAGIRLHADWVFGRGVKIAKWGVARPLNVSDHWPIWAEITLPTADWQLPI